MTRHAYVLLGALVGVLLVGAPAAAEVEWRSVSCATGAMTAATGGGGIHVTGWIQPCPESPAAQGETFAVTYYGAEFGAPMELLAYATPDGRTTFEASLYLRTYEVAAMCLTFSSSGRLSCLSIAGDDAGEPVIAEIPTHDPLVTVPVRPYPVNPIIVACGTCV
jgi:hypothetical protein